jgi:protein-tyrosine phosphatase
VEALFVDCHSHVVPSDDDGAQDLAEGLALCCGASRHGTSVLFATPHVWPHLTLTEERELEVRARFERLRLHAPLDLRLGFELTPTRALLDEDPGRYLLEGTDVVLIEVPFIGSAEIVFALAEHVEEAGLRPLIAHPERTEVVLVDNRVADELAERWEIQVNATSLLGRHGPEPEELGWSLVKRGLASVVASDGHRTTRPPHLDEAYALAERRLGEAALRLFDGSALGLAMPTRIASRAASRGA